MIFLLVDACMTIIARDASRRNVQPRRKKLPSLQCRDNSSSALSGGMPLAAKHLNKVRRMQEAGILSLQR
ncbi:MAG: hypothetical protein LKG62_06620 [Solobacterium sp.]|nr:hypothetical protein [Solobacterium sp.]